MNIKIRIKIGSSVFNTTLSNNATATEFKAMLPMTINMSDLNRNEKFYDFANALTTNASNSSTIQTGDLMLYGNRTLVLFLQNIFYLI
ncbi:cyclophilin-like fold protein [Flavobacterium sp. LT1R49]|uniref:cyclophilin-like fold protein n=1 Tax=Flavobacterium arabinosi TaxID=3398737 RepID=UPI003A89F956